MAYYPLDKNPSGMLFVGDPGASALLATDTTFVYDSGQGFLGINVSQPEYELDVSGTGTFREIRWADGTSQTTAAAGAYTFDAAAGNETAVTINNGDVLKFSGLDGIEVTRSSQTMQFDLKNTAVTPGSYGDASTISTFTVDQQGRLTAAGETSVSITASQVSDFASQVSGVVFDANNFVDSATIDFTVLDGVNVTGAVKTNSINENYLTTSIAGDGLAGGNGTALSVNTDGTTIETNGDAVRIAATAAGNGLAGGGGSALSVNVDGSSIVITSDTLEVPDSGITELKRYRTVDSSLVDTNTISSDINLVSAAGGNVLVNLPAPPISAGRLLYIKKTDSSTNTVTIDQNGSETIDGGASYVLYNQFESVTLICDGTNWHVF